MKRGAVVLLFLIAFACQDSSEIKRQQLFLKGNIALEENNLKKAINYYDQCIAMSDSFPAPYNNRAVAYERMGDYQAAFADYEKAMITSPEFYEAYFNRAKLLSELGNHKSAMVDFEVLEVPYQDSMTYYFARGLAHSGLRNYDKAKSDFSKAKSMDANNTEIDINLATVYYYAGQTDSALQIINDAVKNTEKPEAMNLKALLLAELGEYDSAEMLLNKALAKSSNSYFYNNRGYVWLLKGDLEEGFKDINQSLLMDQDNAWAYRNKGIYFYLKKEYEPALNFLNTSLEMDENTRLAHYYLAQIYFDLAEDDLACQHLHESAINGEEKSVKLYKLKCNN